MNPGRLRTFLASVAADVRDRRLLPVLGLLVVAAVAIPLVLSRSGQASGVPAPLPIPPVTATVPALTPTPRPHEQSQNYLTGPRHNPFISTATTPAPSPSSTGAVRTGVVVTPVPGRVIATTPVTPVPVPPVTPVVRTTTVATTTVAETTTVPDRLPYSAEEAQISLLQEGIGADRPTVFHNLARDQLLPSDPSAFTVFLGVRTDRRTAVFVLGQNVVVSGQGACAPSPSNCTFLLLQPGQAVKLVIPPDPSGSGASGTFDLSFDKLRLVRSSGSTVVVDQGGAEEVKQASAYVPALRTIRYGVYNGLLRIKIGADMPITPSS